MSETPERRGGERRANPPLPEAWHLDRKVPISLILAILIQFAIALLAYGDLKKDVELLKQDSAALHGRDTMHEDQMRETVKLMQDQYARLDAKLDRLIERRQK